ncbi:MAG: hypothetical protein LKM39_03930 [Chiayiivirga sp.]|nr:hypothetical protein [Chiayiivirga sp.]
MRSWRGQPGGHRAQHQAGGDGLVDQDGVVRQQVAHGLADLGRGQASAWAAGALGRLQLWLGLRCTESRGELFQAGQGILVGRGKRMHCAAVGHQVALFPG